MPKLIPIEKRSPVSHCWFCATCDSVKYDGEILNPCPTANNRYIKIVMCSKCAKLHEKHLKEYWLDKS